MDIETIGIDLGKTACDVAAMDGRGEVLARRRLARPKLVRWLANLPPCRTGMEASCGATTWRAGWPSRATTCG